MKKITSFTVDHRHITPGFYLSRVDGDIWTFDMRFIAPNTGELSTLALHSIEHMFATVIRNSEIGEKVIYFGPMGCATGFYLLVRDPDLTGIVAVVAKALSDCLVLPEMPGATERECGNYRNLSLDAAREPISGYLTRLLAQPAGNLSYPLAVKE